MKIDSNTTVEEVKEKTKNTVVGLCSVNKSKPKTISEEIRKQFNAIRKTSEELLDTYRTGRLATSRKSFSEYDFIRLFLSTLLKKGIIKFDSVNLGYRLIDLYRLDEYYDYFFSDMPVEHHIEGDYLDMSSCLDNAYLCGLISSPIQGTCDRLIMVPDPDEIISGYSEITKVKMDKLVNDYLLQQEKMITPSGLVIDEIDAIVMDKLVNDYLLLQEKMITPSGLVIDEINDITKDCRTCQNMSCRVEQNEKPVAGCFGYINNNQDNNEKVKQFVKTIGGK